MAPRRMSPVDLEERRSGVMGRDVEFAEGLGFEC